MLPFLVLLGPSGCGKTTLLRAIAGLGMVDSGRITIDGRDVTYVPAGDRKISMVFQSYANFPHMSVRNNIGFGLRMNKAPKEVIQERVEEAASLLHIEELLDRKPSAMSGGQRQRVAVARALAMKAEVLLMDEPLSNLDALLRLEMRAELKRLLAEVNATTIYVTHDQIEALSMGDRVAVMKDGVLQQVDHPSVVYEDPSNEFVGGFIGNPPMNFIDGVVSHAEGRVAIELAGQKLAIGSTVTALEPFEGKAIRLGIRAENMETLQSPVSDALRVRVEVVEPLGAQNLLTVTLLSEGSTAQPMKVSTHPTFGAAAGEELWIRFPLRQIRWVDPETQQMLSSE
ncbi:MAG: ABC transporter ATP-binding protein [Acidimicrobiaceae bacterium]|nr:ABC transporter ATP-binding protein [Acidimicrobiaceae bacterium]MYC42513.1 ABC transporter ATP-binding protein [Acidimicrobiaceae bacterium]